MFWNEDTPVYIYGAGLKGKLIFELLKTIGCSVHGFLDQAAESICENKNVFHPDQLAMEQRKNCIVVCSVSNVFEHRRIACHLVQQDYSYIVYKEVDGNVDNNKEIIDIIWDAVEDVELFSLTEIRNIIIGREIQAYQNVEKKKEYGINIKEKNGYVDVAIPALSLYTFPKDLYVSFHKRQDWLRIPYERNIYYYLYCADIFRLFENGAMSEQEWENVFKIYKRYFENADIYTGVDLDIKFRQHISQRYSIYHEMNRLFHLNSQFFEENPLYVKWNENNSCLYVRDGNNRLGFLLAKGMHNVTCRMTKNDYKLWWNRQETQRLILSTIEEQVETRMALKWMGKIDLLEKVNRVLLFSSNLLLSDILSKMGVDVVSYEKTVSLEEVDLIWLNLSCVSSQIESDKIVNLINQCSKSVVLEGMKEVMRQFIKRIHGELVEPVYVYWNKNNDVALNLVRRGNYE